METNQFLAIDLGASNGRAILGILTNNRIELKEVHRFENQMIQEEGHFKWDVQRLYNEILVALRKCVEEEHTPPHCIGIDTWGVDFGLLDSNGNLMGKPIAYRDPFTEQAINEVTAKIKPAELYKNTGTQFLPFNSLFQIWSLKKRYPERLLSADKVMFMPDLLTFMLTGVEYSEYTIASTSQMLDPETRKWNMRLLHKLGLPTHILQDLVYPGSVVGNLKSDLQAKLGIGPVPVAAVAAHDTASAIAAIPAEGHDWAYLSSGTWSLLGIESPRPILSKEAFENDFTNEGGVDGTIRFLKNINGLWLLQECKKTWDQRHNYSYSDLADMSLSAAPFACLIDPDDSGFMNPADMPYAIKEYAKKTRQKNPEGIAATTRCIFESLALKYRHTLKKLIQVSGKSINRIHLIGGGAQNQVLCQFTANATGLPVIAGPTEGTALGNLLMQAKALGVVDSLEEIRDIVRQTIVTKTYEPQDQEAWNQAAEKYEQLLSVFE